MFIFQKLPWLTEVHLASGSLITILRVGHAHWHHRSEALLLNMVFRLVKHLLQHYINHNLTLFYLDMSITIGASGMGATNFLQ